MTFLVSKARQYNGHKLDPNMMRFRVSFGAGGVTDSTLNCYTRKWPWTLARYFNQADFPAVMKVLGSIRESYSSQVMVHASSAASGSPCELGFFIFNLLQEDICKGGNIVWKSSKTLVMDTSAIQKSVQVASIRNG